MRVITGSARGRRLAAPPGLETRPTAEVAKEAVFSILQMELEGAHVLDLFAGTGQMGIEALSRGAKSCVFVDNARECIRVQKQNLAHTGLSGRAKVVCAEAANYMRGAAGPFDIAFLDPPYGQGMLSKLLPKVAAIMRESGIILCETDRQEELPAQAGAFTRHKTYRYGKTMITAYRLQQPEEEA